VSHHAIEDLAMARALPGLTVIAPGDPTETRAALDLALSATGPTFIRLGRNNDPVLHPGAVGDLAVPTLMRQSGSSVVLLVTGHILAGALEAFEILKQQGLELAVYSVPMLKPFPDSFVRTVSRSARAVFTIEEHSVVGGLGTAVAEILFQEKFSGKFAKLGLPDEYCDTHGSPDWLRQQYALDPPSIARRVVGLLA
jgi:transketolase